MLLHALPVHTHLHGLCQRSDTSNLDHALCHSYNARNCFVHASVFSHIAYAIGQPEQMALLKWLCLQADCKWGDIPVRGSNESNASSGYSTPHEAVHRRSSLFSTSTLSRPGGLIRSDRQPRGGACDSKEVKRKSAEFARDGKSAEMARDGNDLVSRQCKSAEIAQDGYSPVHGQCKSAETARDGQEISATHRSRSVMLLLLLPWEEAGVQHCVRSGK